MSVIFANISSLLRVYGTFVETDNSEARGGADLPRTLLVGQKLAAGTMTAGVATPIKSPADAAAKAGIGSMLHRMALAAFANDPFAEFWAIALDDASGTAGTYTIEVAASSALRGEIALYVHGVRIPVAVSADDSANDIAAAIAAAVNAVPSLLVTAGVSTDTVTLTCRHKGVIACAVDVRHSYLPAESLPSGVTLTIAAGTAGATEPDVTPAITAMGETPFKYIVWPYTADLDELGTEMDDNTGRWSPTVAVYGKVFAYYAAANFAGIATFGNGRNDQHVTCWSEVSSPSATFELAAALGCTAAKLLKRSPQAGHGGAVVRGVMGPASPLSVTQRNTTLYDGIATFATDRYGRITLGRTITTYQQDAASNADASFLDVQTLELLELINQSVSVGLSTTYAEHGVVDDDTPIAPGVRNTNPKKIRGYLLTLYQEWITRGWVEGFADFAANLVVERNADAAGRVDIVLPPDLVNALVTFAVSNRFRLNYPTVA